MTNGWIVCILGRKTFFWMKNHQCGHFVYTIFWFFLSKQKLNSTKIGRKIDSQCQIVIFWPEVVQKLTCFFLSKMTTFGQNARKSIHNSNWPTWGIVKINFFLTILTREPKFYYLLPLKTRSMLRWRVSGNALHSFLTLF